MSNRLFEINSLTTKIIQKKSIQKLSLKEVKHNLIYSLRSFTPFCDCYFRRFQKKYQPNQIFIEIKHTKYPIEISQLNFKTLMF